MDFVEEKKLIGFAVQNTKNAEKVLKLVSHLDFAYDEHKEIVKTTQHTLNKYGIVDVPTLSKELNITTSELNNFVLFYNIDNLNVEGLAKYIKDKRIKKHLRKLINKIEHNLDNKRENGYLLLDRIDIATKKLREVCKITQFQYTKSKKTVSEFQEYVSDIAENDLVGLPTGIPLLNNKLYAKGYPKGDLTVIGAVRSMGKTALMLQSFFESGKADIPVSFISAEMKSVNLMSRLALRFTDGKRINKENLKDKKLQGRLDTFHKWYESKKLFLEVGTRKNGLNDVNTICDYLEEMKRLYSIQGAFIDYGNRIQDRFEDRKAMRYFKLQEIYRKFKDCAVELDIALVIGHQISQQAESVDYVPTLGDLKESGGVADEADNVIFVFGDREKDKVKCKVAKQRNDAISKVFQMTFDRPKQVFYNSTNEFTIEDLLKEI